MPRGYKEKKLKYTPLLSQMQQLYKDYHIFFTVIAVVALVAIIKNTINNIKQLGVNEERAQVIMDRIQRQPF